MTSHFSLLSPARIDRGEPTAVPFRETLGRFLVGAAGAVVALLVFSLLGLQSLKASALLPPGDPAVEVYRQALPGVVSVVDRKHLGVEASSRAVGSGFVIDLEGHVLTNHHVIGGLLDPGIVLASGSIYPADLVGDDPVHDLAILKIVAAREQLHPLAFGDSNALEVGQQVMAIGSPFGLEKSLTSGVVSFIGRRVGLEGESTIEQAIQTDAAINPGNSGGPLLDARGEVIGVNTATILNGDGKLDQSSAGVGFAIPSSLASRLVPVMVYGSLQTKPWLGLTVRNRETHTVGESRQGQAAVSEAEGAMVDIVVPRGPADEAGLAGCASARNKRVSAMLDRSGDLITWIDGVKVRSGGDLASYLADSGKQVGDVVTLGVERDGVVLEVPVRLRARDDRQADLVGAI